MSIPSDRKLRIAMVCDGVTEYLAGPMLSSLRFAELLTARGHKVIFLAGKSPNNPDSGPYGIFDVFRFRSMPAPFFNGLFLGVPTRRQIMKVLRWADIDIVHIVLPLPSALTALAAARALDIPVVMHSKMQPENVLLNLPRFIPKNWLNGLLYRYAHWLYRKAQAVIFPTDFARQFFATLEGPAINIISNGIDTNVFRELDPGDFIARFNLPRDHKKLLYVGRLHPEKNVRSFIRAAPLILRRHPQAHFLIVGAGREDTKLKRLASHLGISEHVKFFGQLRGRDLVEAYNACDLFVLPSYAEIQPVVVLEAMACGKPLLISDSCENGAAYFTKGISRLFEFGNPEDLAHQASELLSDPATLQVMGQRSRLEASRRHDIRHSVAKLEEIYYSVLPNRAASLDRPIAR
jgi:1,2-diacylglycerol 3-alpha-glucosyltransferase